MATGNHVTRNPVERNRPDPSFTTDPDVRDEKEDDSARKARLSRELVEKYGRLAGGASPASWPAHHAEEKNDRMAVGVHNTPVYPRSIE